MAPNRFLLLILFGSVWSDHLRFHLEHLIDRNVSACDDFYHHVCSQSADPSQFFRNRVASLFINATDRLRPGAMKNSPITYDIERAKKREFKMEDNQYAEKARERCKEDIDCYRADQEYYAGLLDYATYTSIDSTDSLEKRISKYIADTSAMINYQIFILSNSTNYLEKNSAMHFYNSLQSRAHMIEFMKSNSTFGDFHDIYNIFEKMKTEMIENIEASKWLNGDEISVFIREKIVERVASIQIYHDFDELDKNMTLILKLNRDFNDFYFSIQRKTGSVGLDTFVGLRHASRATMKRYNNTSEGVFVSRILNNFQLNAFYKDTPRTITMLAPYMSREAFQSDILKEPFITYSTLGHELYHSLFSSASSTLNTLYSHREECVEQHFERSCEKFAMGACASGHQTFNEDMPDLESYRLLHRILLEEYSERELNSSIEGLETTLEQAFFYYVASEWCTTDIDRTEDEAAGDPHSAGNVRLNAALSLMPEFTNAFGCKAGEQMFVDKESSCYVFGPDS